MTRQWRLNTELSWFDPHTLTLHLKCRGLPCLTDVLTLDHLTILTIRKHITTKREVLCKTGSAKKLVNQDRAVLKWRDSSQQLTAHLCGCQFIASKDVHREGCDRDNRGDGIEEADVGGIDNKGLPQDRQLRVAYTLDFLPKGIL